MEFIILTFVAQREGDFFVSECLELGTSSFGTSEDEALEDLLDATEVYLNTLEDLGEAHQILDAKGVHVYSYEPAMLEVRKARFPAGSKVQPTVIELEHAHA